jgi:putative membrane protein
VTPVSRNKWVSAGLLLWYVIVSVWMAQTPADPEFWLLASILPTGFVIVLIVTHRMFPLSHASYTLITVFLTLHTVGVHYTYAEVPVGTWLQQALDLNRNHFDRIVHFSFGFLLVYPIEELFSLLGGLRGWLLYYLSVMTVLGLSGLWEIVESWVAGAVHPELGITYLGSQGDVWDAQKDMAAALYGALIFMALLFVMRSRRGALPALAREAVVSD